jgi:ATP-dependent DNA helicase RecG
MKPSIEKLRKFFRLEADRDYDNRAVMGGLESMLQSWEAEARVDQLPEELIQAVVARLRDYGRLTPESRKEALHGIWARVRRDTGIGEGDEGEDKEHPAQASRQEKSGKAPSEKSESKQAQPAAKAPEGQKEKATESRKDEEPEEEEIKGKLTRERPAGQEQREKPVGKPKAKRKRRPLPEGPTAALEASITVLDGVGPKNAEKLEKLGIHALGDMLYHFPRRYDDYTQLKLIQDLFYGEEITVIGTVQSASVRSTRGGKMKITEVIVSDSSGALRCTWFNQPWLTNTLKEGVQVVLSGKVEQYLGRLVMNSPEWELLDAEQLHTNRIVPVYPLTGGITQKWLRGQMNKVVGYWAERVKDPLPEWLRDSAELYDLSEALLQAHFPDSWEDLHGAQHRLAFDEVFLLQLGVLRQKLAWGQRSGRVFSVSDEWLQAQLGNLPFELTNAQQRGITDIRSDLSSGRPMNRLLQGDVGSGKTVVAALNIAIIAQEGAQSALMAPTSILAEQHYQGLTQLLAGEKGPLETSEIRLMIGATPESEKEEIRQGLANGQVKLVIGTHALIEDPVLFKELELVIIDEQHRFGVKQRAALRDKGSNPHLLVMTATPIPRSLALTVYGDLDLSVIDEMPPGREPVSTHVIYPRERERVYSLIRTQIEEGRQAFIIYPLVEESEKSEAKAAVEEHERLQKEVLPNLKLGLLHGRMKADEKDEVMTRFRDKETDVLVSTSVVEVGVDVPNATVMVIEGADRFGLAQLHQFRGRVGRGGGTSYCILIPDTQNGVDNERLKVMSETNDGFVLAERDLEQRGPGEFLGTAQSGFSGLRMAQLTDVKLIEKARKHALEFVQRDPEIKQPEHSLLARTLRFFWGDGRGDQS